ncbi:MAG TPA: PfkB family carbohydrate kinase [Acidobacteriota bacterium]|nr:PfkB family carbohydrate kinase [Acidobacteriota bacterium]
MSILVVGSVAYDSVQTPFGEADKVLGGSATYFSISAGFFTDVRLVACVGADFREEDREFLRSRMVDLEGLESSDGETFFWKGRYGYDLNEAETLETRLNVFADFHPRIPDRYRNTEYVFLGNIDPVLQREVLTQVNRPVLVACDTMNYWIEGHFQALQQTLKHVHVLLINDGETRQLAREANLVRAARKILSWGPHTLVVKRGEYGVLQFRRRASGEVTVFAAPAYPLESVFDPTGAGDTFAGGFMGYLAGTGRVDDRAMRQAIVFGSVMASFTVEKFSLDRLRELTFTEIKLRHKEFKELTHFEDLSEVEGESALDSKIADA